MNESGCYLCTRFCLMNSCIVLLNDEVVATQQAAIVIQKLVLNNYTFINRKPACRLTGLN
ncbi:MAG TPA: hypothetical protein VIQ00_06735 [Chitinophagaceae bacterium]